LLMDFLFARTEDRRKEMEDLSTAPTTTDLRDRRADLQDSLIWLYRKRSRTHARPVSFAVLIALVTFCSSIGILWYWEYLPSARTVFGVATAQGIVAAMFVLFAALIGMGRARQQREAARPSAGGGVSTETSAANRQALIGLVGTIITAILAFVGVLVQVFSSGGGQGAGG
jgi:hypothetical protein